MQEWTYRNLTSGHETKGPLSLRYQIEGTAFTDEYTADEASAVELLRLWRKKGYGADYVSIHWLVAQPGEHAPFAWPESPYVGEEDFLDLFTWPRNEAGERVRWSALPVEDLRWKADRADVGGFFQEVTGWKPSALLPRLHVPSVLAAAGLSDDQAPPGRARS